jgi:hypothetical protein
MQAATDGVKNTPANNFINFGLGCSRLGTTIVGLEHSIEYIIHYLNQKKAEGVSFDGFITFSQGGTTVLRLYQALQHFSKQLGLSKNTRLPYFAIFFSGFDMQM